MGTLNVVGPGSDFDAGLSEQSCNQVPTGGCRE